MRFSGACRICEKSAPWLHNVQQLIPFAFGTFGCMDNKSTTDFQVARGGNHTEMAATWLDKTLGRRKKKRLQELNALSSAKGAETCGVMADAGRLSFCRSFIHSCNLHKHTRCMHSIRDTIAVMRRQFLWAVVRIHIFSSRSPILCLSFKLFPTTRTSKTTKIRMLISC